MPVYTFRCRKCTGHVEVQHRFDQPHPKRHKGCGGALVRIFAIPEVVYRVQGFYTVDKRLDPTPEDL